MKISRMIAWMMMSGIATPVLSQDIVDVHCQNILPCHLEILGKHHAELDEGFHLPQWAKEAHQSRNFWHYHPGAEQTLMVLNGEGYYQEEGKNKKIRRFTRNFFSTASPTKQNASLKKFSAYCAKISTSEKNTRRENFQRITEEYH